jgi:hypothetical protein
MKKCIFLLACLFCIGCSQPKQQRVYALSPTDFFKIPKGARIEWETDGGDLIFVEKKGYFISEFYFEYVMGCQLDE